MLLLPLNVQLLIGKEVNTSLPASYKLLGCEKGRAVILNSKGEVEWSIPLKFRGAHDVWKLSNGNFLLHTGPATVEEFTPEKKSVWKYTARSTGNNRVEVHAFQRLDNGNTLVAESGNRRLVEVNQTGKIVKSIPLTVDKPNAHRDTRLVRKLSTGHYLVCHEGDGCVREYDDRGKVIWSYKLDLGGRKPAPGHGVKGHGTSLFSAIRLTNGRTLIGGGNNNRVVEVNKEGKIVWSLDQKEIPGITLAWVTTLHVLPNGNVIVGNTHAGPDNPQLFEVTRKKKLVWSFNNFKTFGNNLAAVQVLGIPKNSLR